MDYLAQIPNNKIQMSNNDQIPNLRDQPVCDFGHCLLKFI
jgi:hypothetical protein